MHRFRFYPKKNNRQACLTLCFMVFLLGLVFSSFSPGRNAVVPAGKPCDTVVPALNQKVIEFTQKHMGRRVGRGQCWDLAAQALDFAGAKWNGKYVYGKLLNPQTDCIYPGDIIQFERVKLKSKTEAGAEMTEMLPHHTAVIYAVKGKGHYQLAHQNVHQAGWGKKVGLSDIELKNVVKGKYMIYRPEN